MKALRLVFGKGVEALRGMAIDTPADAMKAIQLAIREMRVALGEPTDRTAISVEETIRREYERWMVVEEQESDPPADRDAGDDQRRRADTTSAHFLACTSGVRGPGGARDQPGGRSPSH